MITIDKATKTFTLQTRNSCYIMQVLNDRYLVHKYYGKKTKKPQVAELQSPRGFDPIESTITGPRGGFSPDCNLLEFPFFDNGDFRTSALKLRNADGNCSTSFIYYGHKRMHGRRDIPGIPCAAADKKTTTLRIDMQDEYSKCLLHLYYTVFPKENVITRYFVLENKGSESVKIEKAMSLALDMPSADYDIITLPGYHCKERQIQRRPLFIGNQSVMSRRGASSHHYNPFVCICGKKTNELKGDAYGFNFVWSGNFLSEVEVDQYNHTRVQLGLGEENFSWLLEKGQSFTSPEAVMTFTNKGLGQMSRNFHDFIRNRIMPRDTMEHRPVVLNTWEASYFDIDEDKLLTFADSCKETGIDMLVMDDGWFGARDNDNAALGDWTVSKKKFKNGLGAFVDAVKSRGIQFGIWIEPEMVNPDSDLYRAHPDWALHAGNRPRLESRNQLVLDMCNPEVLDYLKKSFSETFKGVAIDYIKWDMNRHMCGVGSPVLPPERQDEVPFRYMLGVYDLYRWFRETYPNVMIENCSGGGGRYDIAMMKYCTQIWTSDNTRPEPREYIQCGSTLAYPACMMSCHVSNPDRICEDPRELNFRFRVATNGMLGYEMDMPGTTDAVRETIAKQIAEYKTYEHLIKKGDLYRLFSPFDTPYYAYYFISKDHREILFTFLQCHSTAPKHLVCKLHGAIKDKVYIEQKTGKAYAGGQLIQGIEIMSAQGENSAMTLYFKTK